MNDKELKEQLKKEMLDLCETNSSVMTYMECLMRKYENLQSKIDKVNEILNRPQFEYDNIPCNYEEDIKELKDILKEEKTDEETVQS